MNKNIQANVLWLKKNMGEKLVAKIAAEGEQLSFELIIRIFIAADPSENKKALDWLVKNYLSTQAFRWEDIRDGSTSMVCETLKRFGEHRNKLTGNARNLQEYTSISEVWRSIQEFVKITLEISGKEVKRQERLAALKDSLIVYQDSQQILAVPLTETAAVWWGRGTRWCTAAERNNYFNTYNQNSPLIVLVVPNGITPGMGTDKFQIWVSDESIQFMDSVDSEVDPKLVAENWPIFKPLLEWALERNLDALKWFPASAYSQEWSDELIEQSVSNFKYIPDKFKTKEMCVLTVRSSMNFLPRVPERFLDEDWVISRIREQDKSTSLYLNNVPVAFRTPAVKKALLESNPVNFIRFPFVDQTKELFDFVFPSLIEIISRNGYPSEDLMLDSVNTELWSKEKLTQIIELSPDHIGYIPYRILDESLYCLAISKGASLSMIPDKFITSDLAKLTVQAKPNNIGFIPHKFLTDGLKAIAYEKEPTVIWNHHHVVYPDHYYMEGLENDWSKCYLLPPHLRTAEICRKAVSISPDTIALLAIEDITIELIDCAMNANGSDALEYILYEFRYKPEFLQFIANHPAASQKLLDHIGIFSDENGLGINLDRLEPELPKETSVNWSREIIQELKDKFISQNSDQTYGLK